MRFRARLALEVHDLFVQLCPTVFSAAIPGTGRARLILGGTPAIGARDAVHAAVMRKNGIGAIASSRRGFDSTEGIERIALGRPSDSRHRGYHHRLDGM